MSDYEENNDATKIEIIADGGAAFPTEQGVAPDGTWNQTHESGMSLRDWFAGMALQGFLASGMPQNTAPDSVAHDAYLIADAMIKYRAG